MAFKSVLSLSVVLYLLHLVYWHQVSAIKWDGLRVTFGTNLTNPNLFQKLPRTVRVAERRGFYESSSCVSSTSTKFRGRRYVKHDDPTFAILYDVNGYIAGVQSLTPRQYSLSLRLHPEPPLVRFEGGQYNAVTVYFVNPAIICSTGRTEEQFCEQGTGTDLYLQINENPLQSIRLPKTEQETVGTSWFRGGCIPKMGLHYWYNVTAIARCKFYPLFLMFTNQQVASFGFLYADDMSGDLYEHPPPRALMQGNSQAPPCLAHVPYLSSLHVYLVDNVAQLTCPLP